MPAVIDDNNIYSEQAGGKLSATVKNHKPLVYVPNNRADSVVVIDPTTFKVLRTVKVGKDPQHVVPSWDMTKLWVTNNAEGRTDGSLTPIDPVTGEFGTAVPVDDPYNMYYTPDGKSAVVVAEAFKRLDLRDPTTWQLQRSISTPTCAGINHADFSGDGTYAIFTCEFEAAIVKVDWIAGTVVGRISFGRGQADSMPQDVRVGPDGNTFYVADMMKDGVAIIDGETFKQTGFVKTGVGTHGIYPSRDGSKLFISNRGQNTVFGEPKKKGSVSVFDPKTNTVLATWPVPGGGSPDMGNLNPDGSQLWLVRSLRRRGLRVRHEHRRAAATHSYGPKGTPWSAVVAPARSLLARPHRQHALAVTEQRIIAASVIRRPAHPAQLALVHVVDHGEEVVHRRRSATPSRRGRTDPACRGRRSSGCRVAHGRHPRASR